MTAMTEMTEDDQLASQLSKNLSRLLLEFGKDYQRRTLRALQRRGHRFQVVGVDQGNLKERHMIGRQA